MSGDGAGAPGTPNPSEQNSDREIPDWVREKLTKANNEAARYRTERNTARESETSALNAKAEADQKVSGAIEDRDQAVLELTKYKALLEAGFPGDAVAKYVGRLSGSTEDELKADAEELFQLFGGSGNHSGYDRSQGLGSNDNSPVTPQNALAASIRQAFGELNR